MLAKNKAMPSPAKSTAMAKKDAITTARNTVTIDMLVHIITEDRGGMVITGMDSKGIANSRVDRVGITGGTTVAAATAIADTATETLPSIEADPVATTLADSLTTAAAGIAMLTAVTDRITPGTALQVAGLADASTDPGAASTMRPDITIHAANTVVAI